MSPSKVPLEVRKGLLPNSLGIRVSKSSRPLGCEIGEKLLPFTT